MEFSNLEVRLINSYLDDIKICYELGDMVKVYKVITTLTDALELYNDMIDEDIVSYCKGEISYNDVIDKLSELYFN